jgi:hypothetical protein
MFIKGTFIGADVHTIDKKSRIIITKGSKAAGWPKNIRRVQILVGEFGDIIVRPIVQVPLMDIPTNYTGV